MAVILVIGGILLALVVVNALCWPRVRIGGAAAPGAVSILIPARDEAERIGAAVAAALAQGAAVGETLVYDDHSSDGTAERARAAAAGDPRLRVLPPAPLPEGWCGKTFACARLATAARGEWLLFLDADARLRPGAAARLVAEAERRRCTLLSAWPGLELRSFWERTLLPLLNHVVFTLFPAPLSFFSNRAALGLAHGACILAQRAEYERTGGHAMVRAELFEDTALARAWRAAGGRALCLDGQDVATVRMYDSFGGIWRGFEKNIRPAFRRELSFWCFLAFRAACFLWPFLALPWALARSADARPAAGAAAAVLLGRAAQAARFGYPLWSCLLHPLAEGALLAVGATSWYKCRWGGGIQWKSRTYLGKGKPS